MIIKLFGTDVATGQRTIKCRHCGEFHGIEELCTPTITRRQFFFLSGMTAAYVATGGIQDLIVPVTQVPPFNLAEANEILKKIYMPHVQQMINDSTILLEKLIETGDIYLPGQLEPQTDKTPSVRRPYEIKIPVGGIRPRRRW